MPMRTRPPDNRLASFCWRYDDTAFVEQIYKLAQSKLTELGVGTAGAAPFPRTDAPVGDFNGAAWREWVASVEASNLDQVIALQRLVATSRIRLGYELPAVPHEVQIAPPQPHGGSDAAANDSATSVLPDISADIRLVSRHNSGLYGVVWSAVQIPLNRNVAVKFIKPGMGDSAMVLDHARTLARVNHRNVVTVHQVARVIDPEADQAADCIVMEWVEGEQLGDRLNGAHFTPEDAISLCLAVLDGLAAIHAQGIVHGDLHPGNVLLTRGEVKIIDIRYADSQSLARLTATSRERHVVGDVEYVAGVVLRVLRHSDIPLPVFLRFEPRLRVARTLDDVRLVVREVEAALKLQPEAPIPPPSVTIRTEGLDNLGETIIGMTDKERAYLLTLSRPRNQQGVPVDYFDSFQTRESAAFSEMIDSFLSRQLMRVQGRVYAMTTAGYRTTDRMWGVVVLKQLSALQKSEYDYVAIPELAVKVGLTDGETEAAELRRLLKELDTAGHIESVPSDDGIPDARLTAAGRGFLRTYATVDITPMD